MHIAHRGFVLTLATLFVASFAADAYAGYRTYRRTSRYSTSSSYSSSKTSTSSCSSYSEPATFYVDGKNGSDSNSGSAAYPFETIQKGIDAAAAQPGDDIIDVAPKYGAYYENVKISDANGDVTVRGCSGKSLAVVVDGGGNRVFDIELLNDVKLENLLITHGSHGIEAFGGEELTLWNVTSTMNSDDGVHVDPAYGAYLHYVSLTKNGGDGADIRNTRKVELNDVVASYNSRGGVYISRVGNVTGYKVTANSNQGSNGGIHIERVDYNVELKYLTSNSNDREGTTITRVEEEASVYHGTAKWNGREGYELSQIDDLRFDYVTASYNDRDGISLSGIEETVLYYVTANHNDDNGIASLGILDIWITRSTANENGDSGLAGLFNGLMEIRFSEFSKNENGIAGLLSGALTLFRVTANHNEVDGVFFALALSVEITDSWFKYNGDDGIDIEGIATATFKYVNATYNGDTGATLDTVLSYSFFQNWFAYNGNQDLRIQ